ncbi:SnoaL-like protein [Acinetobacter calcoaceticus]|uniref:SnoaL-like protein n=1 Tax=Acinetobacter calcoaceticus TaxID=471 RepID=A0A4R1XYF9_ACICA|nr:SnoaL-like protein [Acinetobacter calcoaceticus]
MHTRDVLAVITRFQRVFDLKHWDDFDQILTEHLYVDYSQFRDEAARLMHRHEYKQARASALSHLRLQHNFSNPLVEFMQSEQYPTGPFEAKVCCNYQIYRFSAEDFFHSYGRYEFELIAEAGQWRISMIRQILIQNVGNPEIHYAKLRTEPE